MQIGGALTASVLRTVNDVPFRPPLATGYRAPIARGQRRRAAPDQHSVNEYDEVAHWYDVYVRADKDLSYFRDAAREATAVLDLMAGTGRVSLAMAAATGGTVTCVDRSAGMLCELQQKALGATSVRVICADVCDLPLRAGFDLVVIPFNSLAEVVTGVHQRRVIAEIWRVLEPGGLFICTLHNPRVRRRTLDGMPRVLGTFELPDATRLEITMAGSVDAVGRIARSEQKYRRFDAEGAVVEEQAQIVRFALITRGELEAMANDQGFEVETLHGDYGRSGFDSEHSPFMIWRFRRCRRGAA